MNSVKNYFSPTKLEIPNSPQLLLSPDPKNTATPSTIANGIHSKALSKPDSRKIISNMESVINSVKKKHRHRRKKENNETNKSNPEITDISNILSNSLSFVSPNTSRENVNGSTADATENASENSNDKGRKRRSKGRNSGVSRATEKAAETVQDEIETIDLKENVSANVKAGKRKSRDKKHLNGSIEQARKLSLAGKSRNGPDESTKGAESIEKQTSVPNESINEMIVVSSPLPVEKSTPKVNAFTFMMNARNRSIGSNEVGKEIQKEEIASPTSAGKVKRKLMLQEWADKKGGAKRKLEEVQREEYVEYQMEKRAKRLKRMLTSSQKSSSLSATSTPTLSQTAGLTGDNSACGAIPSSQDAVKESVSSRRKVLPATASKVSLESDICETKVPKGRKKRAKRISSTESEVSVDCSQDSEFVKKLSSPIKKRDSLLGYFPKIVSPTESLEANKNTSPSEPVMKPAKRRGRPPKSLSKNQAPVEKEESPSVVVKDRNQSTNSCPNAEAEILADTPTSRPRRSCISRPRYDEDYFLGSPEKEAESKRSKKQKPETPKLNVKTNNNTESICLDSTDEHTPQCTPKKLAPVFIRSVPKPSIDPAILEARKNFLMSGIPEKLKLEMLKQKQFEEVYEVSMESMFPTISHVGHETNVEDCGAKRSIDWEKCGIAWQAMTNSPDRVFNREETDALNPFTPLKKPLPTLGSLDEIGNKVDIIKSLKVVYDKFPTYRCYKQLRAKYKQTRNLAVQQVSDSFVILNTNAKIKDDGRDVGVNGELLFTEKYKPLALDQVLVNFHPVNQLRDFLLNFQNGKNSNLNDSSNDFDMSNDSISMGSCNSVVLHGPSSSGKTNAVFALANELNFNVLEINAGMKRSGKKLLQELLEATQSHLVKNDNKSNMLKKSFSGLKNKGGDSCDSSSTSELSSSAKLSLILVEDADIVFDQDSGFVDALYQLVAISKRPVVIVSNSSDCPHLSRLMRQSRIEFPRPNILNISKFLSVMSLVENCPIELDDIIRLYLYNKLNLRRTILEMQFFIQSGGDRVRVNSENPACLQSPQKYLKGDDSSNGNDDATYEADAAHKKSRNDVYTHQTLFDFYTLNQNSEFMVQYPLNLGTLHSNIARIMSNSENLHEKAGTQRKNGQNAEGKAKQKAANDLEDIVSFYDNVSIASRLKCSETDDGLCENLGETIAHTIVERAVRLNLDAEIKMDLAPRVKNERLSLSPCLPQNLVRTNRCIDLDYEPTLRSICRSEKFRSQQERRGSRFYHYLRNICTMTTSFGTNEFDKVCSVLDPLAGDDQRNDPKNTTT